ncbi:MAG: hypothetical protein AAGA92_11765 [Planctomycetota bacterium]
MSSVFLDTVGLIALWDEADQWHAAASEAYQNLRSSRGRLLTTTFVMLECGNAAQRRPYRGQVVGTMRQLSADQALVTPTDEDMTKA